MSSERGRPRNFDNDTALDSALGVFWRNGFQSASLAELTEAMGLSKPSLYAAFGDKEGLYLLALERYMSERMSAHAALLDSKPDGRVAVEAFLRSLAAMLSDPALPGGCFIVNGMADHGATATPAPVEQALRSALLANESRLRERIRRAQRDGQLGPAVRAEDLAGYFLCVVAGLAVLAKGGAKRTRLNAMIDTAMGAWPVQLSGERLS